MLEAISGSLAAVTLRTVGYCINMDDNHQRTGGRSMAAAGALGSGSIYREIDRDVRRQQLPERGTGGRNAQRKFADVVCVRQPQRGSFIASPWYTPATLLEIGH